MTGIQVILLLCAFYAAYRLGRWAEHHEAQSKAASQGAALLADSLDRAHRQ